MQYKVLMWVCFTSQEVLVRYRDRLMVCLSQLMYMLMCLRAMGTTC